MSVKTLQIYCPHELQRKIHDSKARFRIVVAARQVGKSTWCLNEILKKAWESPKTFYYFISPTFDQAKVQFRRLINQLSPCPGVYKSINQSELRIILSNESVISFKSGEQLDSLRGATLHGVVIDEYRDQHRDLWPLIIQPMLVVTGGWCTVVSTPYGYDQFYDLAKRAEADTTGDWELFHAESTANPLFTQQEYNRLKSEMSSEEFDQEIRAKFVNIHQGSAYKNYGSHNERYESPFSIAGSLYSPYLPILLSPDFNLNPMAWEIGQYRDRDFYYFDEIYLKNSHTQEASAEFISRFKANYEINVHPQVIICGDATGRAGQRAAAGKSDYAILFEMLTEAGITWENRTPDANPQVKDRVNMMNAHMRSADGSTHFFIHPKRCPNLKRDCERVAWKAGAQFTLDQSTDTTLTHSSDGPGYSVHELSRALHIDPGVTRILRR